jgi:hypothetical protein
MPPIFLIAAHDNVPELDESGGIFTHVWCIVFFEGMEEGLVAGLKGDWNLTKVKAYFQTPENSKPPSMVPGGFGSRIPNLCGMNTFKGM